MTRLRGTALVGFFPPKKWVFPKKLCFQVTWNQPGSCVPHIGMGRSPPSCCTGQAIRPGHRGTMKRPGEFATQRGGSGEMQAHRPGAGRGDCPPYSKQPASSTSSRRLWFCGRPRLRHAAPQTPSCLLQPPTLQLQPCPLLGLLTWPIDDAGRDSPGTRFALCWEDVHTQRAPPGARASPLPFPKNKTRKGDHSKHPPPRAAVP